MPGQKKKSHSRLVNLEKELETIVAGISRNVTFMKELRFKSMI